jgi:hypothetical protein
MRTDRQASYPGMARALLAERLQNLLDRLTSRAPVKQAIMAVESCDHSPDECNRHASGWLTNCGRCPF